MNNFPKNLWPVENFLSARKHHYFQVCLFQSLSLQLQNIKHHPNYCKIVLAKNNNYDSVGHSRRFNVNLVIRIILFKISQGFHRLCSDTMILYQLLTNFSPQSPKVPISFLEFLKPRKGGNIFQNCLNYRLLSDQIQKIEIRTL